MRSFTSVKMRMGVGCGIVLNGGAARVERAYKFRVIGHLLHSAFFFWSAGLSPFHHNHQQPTTTTNNNHNNHNHNHQQQPQQQPPQQPSLPPQPTNTMSHESSTKRKQHDGAKAASESHTSHVASTEHKKKAKEDGPTSSTPLEGADIGITQQVTGLNGEELLQDEEKAKETLHEVAVSAANVPLNGKVALVTGITGQDGSYLAEFLLAKGMFVLVLVAWRW